MAHPRKLIRHAAVALLIGANTAAGARVQATRVEPHKKSQLPAISVYTLHDPVDQAESAQTAPRELKHDLQLEIAAWVAHSDDNPVDDRMDDIAEQIEAAMETDRYINGTAGESILIETTMQVVEDDGRSDPLVGIVTLTYAITYRACPAAPTGLVEFLTADTKHEVDGGIDDDTLPAEDTITVRAP